MNPEEDEQQIRQLIADWLSATAAGDLDRVLTLMAEDVVFLRPGQPPMRGREAYAAVSRPMLGKVQIHGQADIQEVQVVGDLAYCWNHLTITITPPGDQPPKRQVGNVLSVFRREADGRWVLFRDANLLVAE